MLMQMPILKLSFLSGTLASLPPGCAALSCQGRIQITCECVDLFISICPDSSPLVLFSKIPVSVTVDVWQQLQWFYECLRRVWVVSDRKYGTFLSEILVLSAFSHIWKLEKELGDDVQLDICVVVVVQFMILSQSKGKNLASSDKP